MPKVMTSRPRSFPDYEHPPLDEVAIAVQFNELSRFLGIHYGLIYNSFKDHLPHYEEHQPLETRFEVFGRSGEVYQQISVGTKPPLPRVWFISDDRHELIQIQPNRFVHNWRKVAGQGVYPHFEAILPNFFKNLDKLREFTAKHEIGKIEINQCELSYFNNIETLEDESISQAFARVFRSWNETGPTVKLQLSNLEVEAPRLAMTSRILETESGDPIGRLHIDATSATYAESGKQLIRLMLVARGRPIEMNDRGVEQFFFAGREAIVESFDLITSPKCHKLWGRKSKTTKG